LVDETNEFTMVVEKVKLTFLKYPFAVASSVDFKGIIRMPDLLSLGAMKADGSVRKPRGAGRARTRGQRFIRRPQGKFDSMIF
jgi:hypothetical protein